METQENKKKDNHGCFWITFIGLLAILAIAHFTGGSGSSPENYNDNSTTHQILAKNYFQEYIKKNLKNAKSYEEVGYTSDYNYSRECYEVTIRYRATNSFGAMVLEKASADVYFSGDNVSVRNVRTE